MNLQQTLMNMVEGLNMPLSVSGQNGSIREMEQRIQQIREGQVQSMGSCAPPYSSWGN
jgi:hypothetical protein